MNIKFNWEKIGKVGKYVLCSVVASAILYEGGLVLNKVNKNYKNNGYPQLKQVTVSNEKIETEKTINGVTYIAPDGYNLEMINNHLYAVKRYYLVSEPEKITLEDGTVTYYVPEGTILADGLVYREMVELIEPDTIIDQKIL